MFVKPREGLTIRDPDLKDYLPVEGREVPDSIYWHRRVRDGDVTVEPQASKPEPATSSRRGGTK